MLNLTARIFSRRNGVLSLILWTLMRPERMLLIYLIHVYRAMRLMYLDLSCVDLRATRRTWGSRCSEYGVKIHTLSTMVDDIVPTNSRRSDRMSKSNTRRLSAFWVNNLPTCDFAEIREVCPKVVSIPT